MIFVDIVYILIVFIYFNLMRSFLKTLKDYYYLFIYIFIYLLFIYYFAIKCEIKDYVDSKGWDLICNSFYLDKIQVRFSVSGFSGHRSH